MLEYRVGDKVRIKNKKWYNSLKNRNEYIDSEIVVFGFNADMAKLCGKIGIIIKAVDCTCHGKEIKKYFLDIDNKHWSWSEDMFETNNNILEIE